MTTDLHADSGADKPVALGSTDGLGPLPEPQPRPGPDRLCGYSAQQMRAYAAEQVAAERERWMRAVSWALGTNGDFREQGTMEGRYWWRGELAERAGLRWDGTQWVDAV